MKAAVLSGRSSCGAAFLAVAFTLAGGIFAWSKPSPVPIVPPLSGDHYFFSIDLDPRYQIIGVGALTEEEAARANCYCYRYDARGRLQRIEYRQAGVPAPDPLFDVPRIDFEYANGMERRWYRDGQGQPTKSVDDIFGEELALNPAGFPVGVTNLDATGGHTRDSSAVVQYVRTLDKANRLIRGRRDGLLGLDITDNNGFFETRTVYDDQGRRMEYGNYDASGNPLNDDDGVALIRTTYVLFPSLTQTTDSYFDASGLPVGEKSSGVHQRQRTFDKRGLLISEAFFDVTGAPTADSTLGVHEHRFVHDARGNLLEESFLDPEGRLSDQKTAGYARVVYEYDDKNRIITKSYFGDDGSPQVLLELGAAVIKQEYDDAGNLVRRQFFDGQGHPSRHLRYGAPAIRIGEDADTTTITLRDAQDHITTNPVTGYAAFSYKTATDHPLSHHNHFYDRRGRAMSKLRVFIINPHLYALSRTPVMQISARAGAFGAGLGALIAMAIALRKMVATRRRHVYVPTPLDRFLGWFSIFALIEGMLRFFITVYWSYLYFHYGHLGPTVYVIEGIVILFFLYRLLRTRVTMRVLNVTLADVHGIIREFFAQAQVESKWFEEKESFVSPELGVRLRYFPKKSHAYLTLHARHHAGRELSYQLARYIRAQAATLQGPPITRMIAFYYPCVAFCYFLLAGTAFYTLWQLVKSH